MSRSAATPTVMTRVRSLIGRSAPPMTEYPSYDVANAACHDGYAAPDIARLVAEKTGILRDDLAAGRARLSDGDMRVMSALGCVGDRDVRVLDFGGGAGAHFWVARSLTDASAIRQWAVVETPNLASAAATSDERLSFHTTIEEAAERLGTVDLVFASGVIPYVPDPVATLASLAALGARVVFLTRTPLSPDAGDHVLVHTTALSTHGPGSVPVPERDRPVSCPVTLQPGSRLLAPLRSAYPVVREVTDGPTMYRTTGGTASMVTVVALRA